MNRFKQILIFAGFITGIAGMVGSVELTASTFSLELQKIRYDNRLTESIGSMDFSQFENEDQADGFSVPREAREKKEEKEKQKSPTKAFLMSFALPGLGQYYNGSKIKAAAFLGFEAAGWLFNRKFSSQGNDLEAEFEAFNRANWQRVRYDSCLTALDTTEGTLGFSHHLPATTTQQYYEMTGKYDQFSWGWIDATIIDGADTLDLAELIALNQLQAPVPSNPASVPNSPFRDTYEQMRYDSNQKFKSARRWASLILANHLISGLEAFFAARRHNAGTRTGAGKQWGVKAGLKSYYAVQDTPYLQLSYKF